jgi:hypothetical protein
MMSYDEIDELFRDPISPQYEFYRARDKEIDRCRIVFTNSENILAAAKVHYHSNRFFLCKGQHNDENQICCRRLNSPKIRVAAVLAKYETNHRGFISYPLNFNIHPWIFGERTFTQLQQIHSTFPLNRHDFKIDCLSQEFQALKLIPCEDTLWTEQLNQTSFSKISSTFDYAKRSLGEDLSIEEINNLLRGNEVARGGEQARRQRDRDRTLQALTRDDPTPVAEEPVKPPEYRAPGKRRIRID